MKLFEKNSKNIVTSYAVTTLGLWATIFLILVALSFLGIFQGVGGLLFGASIFLGPTAITWLSAKQALRGETTHHKDNVYLKVMLVNAVFYLVPAIVMLFIEVGVALILALFAVAPATVITLKMFKVPKVAESENTVKKDVKFELKLDTLTVDQQEKLAQFHRLTSATKIGGWYVTTMAVVIGIVYTVMYFISQIFDSNLSDPLLWFLLILRFATPTVAAMLSYRLLRDTQMRRGDNIGKQIHLNGNLPLYLIVLFLTDITSPFNWIITAASFLPVIMVSHLLIKKIANNAVEITDDNFSVTTFKNGFTENHVRTFLMDSGLNTLDVLWVGSLNSEGLEKKKVHTLNFYLFAFDEEQLHMFEVNGKKVSNHCVVPKEMINITHVIEMKSGKRIELFIGLQERLILEIRFDLEKRFANQERMFARFIEIFGKGCPFDG